MTKNASQTLPQPLTPANGHQHSQTAPRAIGKTFQILAAALLGLTITFAVGFLPMEAAHNAAHDSRHSHAFPCH